MTTVIVSSPMLHYYDSAYRENKSEPSTDFHTIINIPQGHNRMSLMNISIPKSYYLIRSGFNTFTLTDQNTLVVYTITIPVGNYSISELITQLNTLLSTPTNLHITLSFIPLNGKIRWTTGSNRHYVGSFNMYLMRVFGWSTDTKTFIHSNPSVDSENVVNFQSLQSITMTCNIVKSNPYDYQGGILHQILVNSGIDFSYITFETPHPEALSKDIIVDTSAHVTPVPVRFSLLDDLEKPLDLNGLDVLFQIYTYYEPTTNLPLTQYNLFRDWFAYQIRMEEERKAQA